jgi:hypothetical protein
MDWEVFKYMVKIDKMLSGGGFFFSMNSIRSAFKSSLNLSIQFSLMVILAQNSDTQQLI